MTILNRTKTGLIYNDKGMFFNEKTHAWVLGPGGEGLEQHKSLTAYEAAEVIIRNRHGRKLPVGVIGPNEASDDELASAHAVGAAIAKLGLPMICGGRGGAMAAASQGHAEAGGTVIGILPSGDWSTANSHVAIPIATGLGEARNVIIASACFALIAVGGGYGTLSEMALGLKLERLVIAMPCAHLISGALSCGTVKEAMEAVAASYLGLGA